MKSTHKITAITASPAQELSTSQVWEILGSKIDFMQPSPEFNNLSPAEYCFLHSSITTRNEMLTKIKGLSRFFFGDNGILAKTFLNLEWTQKEQAQPSTTKTHPLFVHYRLLINYALNDTPYLQSTGITTPLAQIHEFSNTDNKKNPESDPRFYEVVSTLLKFKLQLICASSGTYQEFYAAEIFKDLREAMPNIFKAKGSLNGALYYAIDALCQGDEEKKNYLNHIIGNAIRTPPFQREEHREIAIKNFQQCQNTSQIWISLTLDLNQFIATHGDKLRTMAGFLLAKGPEEPGLVEGSSNFSTLKREVEKLFTIEVPAAAAAPAATMPQHPVQMPPVPIHLPRNYQAYPQPKFNLTPTQLPMNTAAMLPVGSPYYYQTQQQQQQMQQVQQLPTQPYQPMPMQGVQYAPPVPIAPQQQAPAPTPEPQYQKCTIWGSQIFGHLQFHNDPTTATIQCKVNDDAPAQLIQYKYAPDGTRLGPEDTQTIFIEKNPCIAPQDRGLFYLFMTQKDEFRPAFSYMMSPEKLSDKAECDAYINHLKTTLDRIKSLEKEAVAEARESPEPLERNPKFIEMMQLTMHFFIRSYAFQGIQGDKAIENPKDMSSAECFTRENIPLEILQGIPDCGTLAYYLVREIVTSAKSPVPNTLPLNPLAPPQERPEIKTASFHHEILTSSGVWAVFDSTHKPHIIPRGLQTILEKTWRTSGNGPFDFTYEGKAGKLYRNQNFFTLDNIDYVYVRKGQTLLLENSRPIVITSQFEGKTQIHAREEDSLFPSKRINHADHPVFDFKQLEEDSCSDTSDSEADMYESTTDDELHSKRKSTHASEETKRVKTKEKDVQLHEEEFIHAQLENLRSIYGDSISFYTLQQGSRAQLLYETEVKYLKKLGKKDSELTFREEALLHGTGEQSLISILNDGLDPTGKRQKYGNAAKGIIPDGAYTTNSAYHASTYGNQTCSSRIVLMGRGLFAVSQKHNEKTGKKDKKHGSGVKARRGKATIRPHASSSGPNQTTKYNIFKQTTYTAMTGFMRLNILDSLSNDKISEFYGRFCNHK